MAKKGNFNSAACRHGFSPFVGLQRSPGNRHGCAGPALGFQVLIGDRRLPRFRF